MADGTIKIGIEVDDSGFVKQAEASAKAAGKKAGIAIEEGISSGAAQGAAAAGAKVGESVAGAGRTAGASAGAGLAAGIESGAAKGTAGAETQVQGFGSRVRSAMASVGSSASQAYNEAVSGGFSGLASSIGSKVSGALKSTYSFFTGGGSESGNRFVSATSRALGSLNSNLLSVAMPPAAAIKSLFDSKGRESGEGMGSMIAKGFTAKAAIIMGVASSIAQSVISTITASIGSAVSRVDTLANYPTVLHNLGYSAEDAAKSTDTLSERLSSLPTRLDAAASGVQQLAPASRSVQQATDRYLAFNDALLAGAASEQVQENAMQQLTKSLSTGKMEMDSWMSIQQAMPGQLTQVARAMLGADASASDLYDAMKDGTISTQQFADAMVELDQNGAEGIVSFAEQAESATGGIGTSFRNMQNAVTKGVAKVIQEVGSSNIVGAINNVKAGINQAFDALVSLVEPARQKVAEFTQAVAKIDESTGVFSALYQSVQGFLPQLSAALGTFIDGALAVLPGVLAGIATSAGPLIDLVGAALPIVAGMAVQVLQVAAGLFTSLQPAVAAIYSAISSALPAIQAIWDTVWPAISAAFSSVWAVIGATVETAMNVIKAVIETVTAVISGDWQAAWEGVKAIGQAVWDGIKAVVTTAINGVKGIVSGVLNAISSVWSGVWNAILAVLRGVWNLIVGAARAGINNVSAVISGVLNGIASFWSGVWNGVASALSSAWNGMKTAASNGVTGVVNAVRGVKDKVTGFFSGAGSWLVNSGKAMLDGLTSGIQRGISGAIGAVKSGLSKIRSFFPFSPAKRGPFAGRGYTTYSGKALMRGFAEGIDSAAGAAVRATKGTLADIRREMGGVHVDLPVTGGGSPVAGALGATVSRVQVQAAQQQAAATTVNQTVNFNHPVSSPDEVARTMRLQQNYGLAGQYA